MILEALVRIEMPPFTALVHDMNGSVAVFVAPTMPARPRIIKLRVKLQPGHPPEAAGLGDRADSPGEEAVGPVMTLSKSGVVSREVTYVISWSVYQVDLLSSSPTASL